MVMVVLILMLISLQWYGNAKANNNVRGGNGMVVIMALVTVMVMGLAQLITMATVVRMLMMM